MSSPNVAFGPDRATILVADIGGTFIRFALAHAGRLCNDPQRFERTRWPTLGSACREYLQHESARVKASIAGAVIAAAGPVHDGRIAMTNAAWSIDPNELAPFIGIPATRVKVMNDFVALGRALPHLDTTALSPACPDQARDQPCSGNRVIVGPGSGLGVVAVLQTAEGLLPLATEGGHASCTPGTDFEHAAYLLAERRYGRCSWERLLSGPGLSLLHEVACQEAGQSTPAIAPVGVLAACAAGEPRAVRAAQAFLELLGAFAGDLALLYDARGGVILAGDMTSQLANLLALDRLRSRFNNKGRFSTWVATLPIRRLNDPFAALVGAAAAYGA